MTVTLAIPTRRGLLLDALLDLPSGISNPPVVIVLHGFTGWKEEPHLESVAKHLASCGIAALRFDASGSGKSQGNWAEHYRLSAYIKDVADVLSYAEVALPVSHARAGIWGHSMGGFVALAAAAQQPGRFAAVCGVQPSDGRLRLTPKKKLYWHTSQVAPFPHEYFTDVQLSYEFYEDSQGYDVMEVATCLADPLLLIAGAYDRAMSAKKVRKILDNAPVPKQYEEFPIDHNYKRDQTAIAAINHTTSEFFQRYFTPVEVTVTAIAA